MQNSKNTQKIRIFGGHNTYFWQRSGLAWWIVVHGSKLLEESKQLRALIETTLSAKLLFPLSAF